MTTSCSLHARLHMAFHSISNDDSTLHDKFTAYNWTLSRVSLAVSPYSSHTSDQQHQHRVWSSLSTRALFVSSVARGIGWTHKAATIYTGGLYIITSKCRPCSEQIIVVVIQRTNRFNLALPRINTESIAVRRAFGVSPRTAETMTAYKRSPLDGAPDGSHYTTVPMLNGVWCWLLSL